MEQGKRSLLEALYFNSTGKSFRTTKSSEMMKYGYKRTGVYVVYKDNIGEKTLTVKFNNEDKKEYSYNGKRYSMMNLWETKCSYIYT